ncbi:uncharacterized protein (TIGR03083 family) [Williamsia limnetica]|jgi:uncharacterized protein (TIGR03083 family)|uniref:Uncharacterized protein (TIGR03083 family) n=1 Tax=Williamsia limnetica TaxID=882452 RepID=A0A318RTP7_WILLI|nr:maleylpyruvate isomerase family mycothiol-dependent enzyme [Williamsia limnetica]PYE19368.1 uncharacterized protein (TIGR03083 family) [Williamsia limnetica]
MTRTIVPKEPAIAALASVWGSIRALAGELTAEQWDGPSILPGWSVGDVVAHVMTTELLLLGDPVPETDVDVESFEHVHNEIGAMNERWLEHYRARGRVAVLADFDDTTSRRIKALQAMTQDDFDADSFTPAGPDTYGRFMRIRVFDSWMHELDLRDTLGLAPPADAASAALAFDEIYRALPFLVGKKAGAPKGSRVRIVVTGLVESTVNVAVDGRASIVSDFDVEPTVTVTVNYADFARLTAGRATADPTVAVVAGDRALGEDVLGNLTFAM